MSRRLNVFPPNQMNQKQRWDLQIGRFHLIFICLVSAFRQPDLNARFHGSLPKSMQLFPGTGHQTDIPDHRLLGPS